uniref:C-type lectin domain-containing protein n=1 Tax=Cyprinus carpio TaxID=7962 RepID=A0A8C2ILN4_CYPCA
MFSCLAGGLSVGSKCAVLSTVCLGLTCILVAVIVVLHINQKKLELETRVIDLTTKKGQLETRVKDLTAEKSQLRSNFSSLSQKNLESLLLHVYCFEKCLCKNLCGSGCFFMSTELSWSNSRQYCRDRGADLVIINTEEKQVSFERVWIGLSDTENEGIMKWVDNSTLKQGFWLKGEPNNYGGNEDCIQLNFNRGKTGWSPLNSWNDMICSEKIKGICEK